jgi:hypothetical protein
MHRDAFKLGWFLAVGLSLLVSAGCDRQGATQPKPAPDSAANRAAVRDLWTNYSASWTVVPQDGFNFIATHSYPDLHVDAATCRQSAGAALDGYRERGNVDAATLKASATWKISRGDQEGATPRGAVYEMKLELQFRSASRTFPSAGPERVHVTVLNGRAYFFPSCEKSRPASRVADLFS